MIFPSSGLRAHLAQDFVKHVLGRADDHLLDAHLLHVLDVVLGTETRYSPQISKVDAALVQQLG